MSRSTLRVAISALFLIVIASPVHPDESAEKLVKASGLKGLKGVHKVAIPQFRVEYVVRSEGKAGGQDYMTKRFSSTKSTYKLSGVDNTRFQAVADQLYDMLVADLQAAGLEVVPHETLKENAEYRKMIEAVGKPYPFETSTSGKVSHASVFYSAHGMPIYFEKQDATRLGLGDLFSNAFQTPTGAAPNQIEPSMAKSLGAALLKVRLVFTFAELSSHSSGLTSSSLKAKLRLSVLPEATNFTLLTANDDDVILTLKEPVAQKEETVLEVKELTKTSEKVLGALLGHSTREYEAVADSAGYQAAAIQQLGDVDRMFVARMKESF